MRLKNILLIVFLMNLSFPLFADEDGKMKEKIKEALYLELGLGQREKAYDIYEHILKAEKLPIETRALILLRKGIVLESFGKRDQAMECYETIVNRLGKVERIVREAQERMNRKERPLDRKEMLQREIEQQKNRRNELIRGGKDKMADEVDNELLHLRMQLKELDQNRDKNSGQRDMQKKPFAPENRGPKREFGPDVSSEELKERAQHLENKLKVQMEKGNEREAEEIRKGLHQIREVLEQRQKRGGVDRDPHGPIRASPNFDNRRKPERRDDDEREESDRPKLDKKAHKKEIKNEIKELNKDLKELKEEHKKAEKNDKENEAEHLERKIRKIEEKIQDLEEQNDNDED